VDYDLNASHGPVHCLRIADVTPDHIDGVPFRIIERSDVERADDMSVRQQEAAEIDAEKARATGDEIDRAHHIDQGSSWCSTQMCAQRSETGTRLVITSVDILGGCHHSDSPRLDPDHSVSAAGAPNV
jgi:hypothetical protein